MVMKKLVVNLIKSSRISCIGNRTRIAKSCFKKINPKKNIGEAIQSGLTCSGYVPYIKGQTVLYLYHFFSYNYGLRQPLNVCISLFGEGTAAIASAEVILDTRRVQRVNLGKIFRSDLAMGASTCVVHVVHKRLKKDHGGFEGHFRFFGVYNGFSAYSHSMPLPSSISTFLGRYSEKLHYERLNYNNDIALVSHYSIFSKPEFVDDRGDLRGHETAFGFSVAMDQDLSVKGCWHHGERKDVCSSAWSNHQRVIVFPPLDDLDAHIYFREFCGPCSTAKLSVHHSEGMGLEPTLILEKVINIDLDHGLRLSHMLPANILKKKNIWIAVTPISGDFFIHMNVVYGNLSSGNSFDCVHDFRFVKSGGNALKFAPFDSSSMSRSILSIVSGDEQETRVNVRVIFLNDPNTEIIHNMTISKKAVAYLDINELISSRPENSEGGIVQIESTEANVYGAMFVAQNSESALTALAVDHLTGG